MNQTEVAVERYQEKGAVNEYMLSFNKFVVMLAAIGAPTVTEEIGAPTDTEEQI